MLRSGYIRPYKAALEMAIELWGDANRRSDALAILRMHHDDGDIEGSWSPGDPPNQGELRFIDLRRVIDGYKAKLPALGGRASWAAEDEPFVAEALELLRDKKAKYATEAARIVMAKRRPKGASEQAIEKRLVKRINARRKN
jgi:hypothetical protein